RPMGRSHAVALHDDEAKFRERHHGSIRSEGLGRERAMRAGIDVLDHRVLFVRIKVLWTAYDAPDVGFAVAAFGDEDFRRAPAGGFQRGDVGLFDLADERTIGDTA